MNLRTVSQKRANEMVQFIKKLDGDVERIILSGVKSKLNEQTVRKQVNAVQVLTKATDKEIREWLSQNVPRTYVDGVNIANKTLKEQSMEFDVFMRSEKTLFHRSAMNMLLKDAYLDFGNTMVSVVKGAERILSDTAKRQIRANIVTGEITGASVREISKDIISTLEDEGFRVLITRAGTRWSLDSYAEMLARTHLIKSGNEGVVNRTREAGSDIVEVLEQDPQDDICEEMDGKIFSISGDSENYDKLDDFPPFHPNCRGTLLPRPELE